MPKSTYLVLTKYGDFEVKGVFDHYFKNEVSEMELSLFGKNDEVLAVFSKVKCFGQKKYMAIPSADIAQKVEPLPCKQEVTGSIPVVGSNECNHEWVRSLTHGRCSKCSEILETPCCHHISSYNQEGICEACRDGGFNR